MGGMIGWDGVVGEGVSGMNDNGCQQTRHTLSLQGDTRGLRPQGCVFPLCPLASFLS